MSKEDAVVGMIVSWVGSPYTIIGKNSKGVILRQNFSIGITLDSEVPYDEIRLVESA